MASSEEVANISMEHNQESTCADTEMSQGNGKLHNGDATKTVSDTVGQNTSVNAEGSATSNHTEDTPCNDKKRETRTKRRERSKEESGTDKKPSAKELTELDKYWKVVEDNPSDFTGWTYLLQYVEQEKNMATVRKAFDAFLTHYPYCYGYWKKYADLEKEPDKTEEVFEHGVKAVALSIDLWIHYLTFAVNKYASHANKVSIIRDLFERGMAAAGLDFRSDKLWQMYIKWEKENGDLHRVTALHDRLLTIPTQLYRHHFDCFTEFVNSHHPKDVLDVDEFLRLRNQIFVSKSALHTDITADDDDTDSPSAVVEEPPPGLEAAPGEEAPPGTTDTATKGDDTEVGSLREKIIELRRAMFDALQTEVSKRWTFEETVRRPYFHVKPLEKSQLKNWRDYLDFEISCGSHERIVILFERCVITCALYEELWLKYAKYQEPRGIDAIRHVLQRACHIHLPKKPHIHFSWAAYEERHGKYEEAAAVLHRLERNMNGLAMVSLRCIGLARRQGNFSRIDELYKDYIGKAESSEVRSFYAVKYARYLAKVIGNVDAAKAILEDALDSDQSNHKLYLQLVDLEYQKSTVDEQAMLKLFARAIDGPLPTEHRVAFSQRRLEFLEDFGSNVTRILDAYEEHQKILKELQSTKKRKVSESQSQESADKKTRTELTPDVASSNYVQPAPVMQPYGDMNAAYNYPQHWGAYANPTGYGYQHPGWSGYAQQYYGAQ